MPEWYEKEIGPLPLGVWVGVVAVGAGASILINRKSKTASPTSTAPGGGDAGATGNLDGALGAGPAGVNLGGIVALPGGVPAGQVVYSGSGSNQTPITDNVSWLRSAENQLIAKGYDPVLVDSALRAYLNGQTPTTAQSAIVSLALQLVGAPPSPVLSVPTPTPTPAPKYGPVWPQSAPGTMPADTSCPPSAPYLVQGATGYTCTTASQYNALVTYIKGFG